MSRSGVYGDVSEAAAASHLYDVNVMIYVDSMSNAFGSGAATTMLHVNNVPITLAACIQSGSNAYTVHLLRTSDKHYQVLVPEVPQVLREAAVSPVFSPTPMNTPLARTQASAIAPSASAAHAVYADVAQATAHSMTMQPACGANLAGHTENACMPNTCCPSATACIDCDDAANAVASRDAYNDATCDEHANAKLPNATCQTLKCEMPIAEMRNAGATSCEVDAADVGLHACAMDASHDEASHGSAPCPDALPTTCKGAKSKSRKRWSNAAQELEALCIQYEMRDIPDTPKLLSSNMPEFSYNTIQRKLHAHLEQKRTTAARIPSSHDCTNEPVCACPTSCAREEPTVNVPSAHNKPPPQRRPYQR